ncbi:MAG TPA: hypothetical protein VGL82_22905 [Bryobacteraceae bacterium]|jgi:hypothetical protein
MRQIAFLAGLLCSVTAFAADPQLMNMVPPDAKVLAGFNEAGAVASPLGRFLIAKIGQSSRFPQGFENTTGFNPLQNVSEILAATTADPKSPGGLILARGTFPVDKISAALTGANPDWQATTYSGATLLNMNNPKEKTPFAVAFLGNSIALAGDLASVKAAIDRNSTVNSIDPTLAAKVSQLSANEDEWVICTSLGSLIPASATADAKGPAATVLPLLQNIQSFSGGAKSGENVVFTGDIVTNSDQNAAALNAVIRLGITLGAGGVANAANNPQLAQAVQLLQAMQITTNGPAVDLSLSISEAQIETLINSLPMPTGIVVGAHVRPAALK